MDRQVNIADILKGDYLPGKGLPYPSSLHASLPQGRLYYSWIESEMDRVIIETECQYQLEILGIYAFCAVVTLHTMNLTLMLLHA